MERARQEHARCVQREAVSDHGYDGDGVFPAEESEVRSHEGSSVGADVLRHDCNHTDTHQHVRAVTTHRLHAGMHHRTGSRSHHHTHTGIHRHMHTGITLIQPLISTVALPMHTSVPTPTPTILATKPEQNTTLLEK